MTAYKIESGGRTKAMTLVHCRDEDRELQSLLENNPALLPGEQINPEEPRRWLTIAREMPVPDPNTGTDRWNIDFVLVDQSAVLTFVEVKRYEDTRSRREVIGQMFDYAANGHYYWTASLLREFAEGNAVKMGKTLEAALQQLDPDGGLVDDSFFDQIAENLREGQIRLVFFMERASMELKSIVDFLNKQMERTEVLLVEAKQYESDGMRVVVPQLFGYTEEARRAKRTVNVVATGTRKRWDEKTFFEELERNLGEDASGDYRELYTICHKAGNIVWGTGKTKGSINPRFPDYFSRSPFSIWSDGAVTINFQYISGSEQVDRLRGSLKELLLDEMGLSVPDDYEQLFPNFKHSELKSGISKLCRWTEQVFNPAKA